jgi:hypothetical protein
LRRFALAGALLAVLEPGLEILPGEDLQLPVVAAALRNPGQHVGAGIAGAVIGPRGDGEVAAFDHPTVVAGELVGRVQSRKLDVPLSPDRLLEMVDDRANRPAGSAAKCSFLATSGLMSPEVEWALAPGGKPCPELRQAELGRFRRAAPETKPAATSERSGLQRNEIVATHTILVRHASVRSHDSYSSTTVRSPVVS